MMQKKICLLGAFAVGKTSLIRRYVSSIFDEKYLTTVGVKIDKKVVTVGDQEVMMLIWDISGQDEFKNMNASYLRGGSGYIVVVDGTRPQSYESALAVQDLARSILGDVPAVIAVNKFDLDEYWLFTEAQKAVLESRGSVFFTSAKTGKNVDLLFQTLVEKML